MHKILKKTVTYLLITSLILIPFSTAAFAQSREMKDEDIRGKMVVDVLLVRPLGIVATVFGIGLFIVSSPFSAMGGNINAAGEKLVIEPGRFTFTRPLGEF